MVAGRVWVREVLVLVLVLVLVDSRRSLRLGRRDCAI
jgi:hypothetical protein